MTHSAARNTGKESVVYRSLDGNDGLWARPEATFLETVQVDGRSIPRSQLIDESEVTDSSSERMSLPDHGARPPGR
jgi:hypothetical protein